MALPDRTLCWVEGPPWDRVCDPVGEPVPQPLDVDALRRRLGDLDGKQLGVVLALVLSGIDAEAPS